MAYEMQNRVRPSGESLDWTHCLFAIGSCDASSFWSATLQSSVCSPVVWKEMRCESGLKSAGRASVASNRKSYLKGSRESTEIVLEMLCPAAPATAQRTNAAMRSRAGNWVINFLEVWNSGSISLQA